MWNKPKRSPAAKRQPIAAATDDQLALRAADIAIPAFFSAILLWAAFPPLSWSWLGWLAPLGWLSIIERQQVLSRGAILLLWISGCAFWLVILQGIRLAYWPLYAGWAALSVYLAVYIPLFVVTARSLRRNWKWSLWLAAPVAWVGWELIRAYMLTGYAANQLVHTQARQPLILQLADQLGGYGISFIMLVVCSAVFQIWQTWRAEWQSSWRQAALPAAIALGCFVAVGTYGSWRLAQSDRLASEAPLLRVLLVQENAPTMFDGDGDRMQQAWRRYLKQTRELASQLGPVDLVVWPESIFSAGSPWVDPHVPSPLPEDMGQADESRVRSWIADRQSDFENKVQMVLAAARDEEFSLGKPARTDRPHLLLGSDAVVIRDAMRHFNSALFVGPDGRLIDRYDKIHLVMFGEYIPLGPLLGWLRDAYGLGCSAGSEPKCFRVGETCLAPSICFESTLPRLIGWQRARLAAKGAAPDVFVNITNDSWFHGSSILDHHLACTILCAVENRRPMLVAANSGLSANIDGAGRVLGLTGRSAAGGLLAEPRRDGRFGLVQRVGYPLAWFCACVTLLALIEPALRGRRARRLRQPQPP